MIKYTADQLIGMATAHEVADRYKQGQWWKDGKGCSLGCMFHEDVCNGGDYFAVAEETTGIPCAVNRIQLLIFEWLPVAEAKTWTREFYELRPSEKDLSQAIDRLMLWILEHLQQGEAWAAVQKHPGREAAFNTVMTLYRRKLAGDAPSKEEWKDAEEAAKWEASWAGREARTARPAAVQTAKWKAAWAIRAADDAAAWATEATAESATRVVWAARPSVPARPAAARPAALALVAAYAIRLRDTLVEIIKSSPEQTP